MKIGSYELQVPFVTTASDNLKTIVEFASYSPGKTAVDLGSGDGRVALSLAKTGFAVTGYELKPALSQRAKKRATELQLTATTHFFTRDFWDENLSSFDVIYIYGMGSIMGRLEQKLAQEMKPGARFISNVFRLPHWRAKKTKQGVHLYMRGNEK